MIHRRLARPEFRGNLLVEAASHDQRHNLTLARRQPVEPAHSSAKALPFACRAVRGKLEGGSCERFALNVASKRPLPGLVLPCPGHPRLDTATIAAPKTWVAGQAGLRGYSLVHSVVAPQPRSFPRIAPAFAWGAEITWA